MNPPALLGAPYKETKPLQIVAILHAHRDVVKLLKKLV
jgi:hypothetical protein